MSKLYFGIFSALGNIESMVLRFITSPMYESFRHSFVGVRLHAREEG